MPPEDLESCPSAQRQILNVFAALLLLAGAGFAAEVQPADDCSPAAAAGKASAPFKDSGPSNSFRIIWHIGTQIEDLADAGRNPEALETISSVQKLVDGYYFNVLRGGKFTYWPGRPRECALNAKMYKKLESQEISAEELSLSGDEIDVRKDCDERQKEYLAGRLGKDATMDPNRAAALLHAEAMKRVIDNLGVKSEQQRGKVILS